MGTILSGGQRDCVSLKIVHNVIFAIFKGFRYVVDAADQSKLEASKREFKALIEKPQLASIPILVLGNKNDLPEALTAEQLIQV